MASEPAYEAIRLIEPFLLDCVKASKILIRIDGRRENPTTRVGLPLKSIEKNLVGALVLLLNRTDHCRHPFRDTSPEEDCFKATLRGCANLMSTLSLLEVGKEPVAITWSDVQNLLEDYDKSLADLLRMLSPARTVQASQDFFQSINDKNQKLKRLVDNAQQGVGDTTIPGQNQQENRTSGIQPTSAALRMQPPSRQSTTVDDVPAATRPHANCSGYRRGLREGRNNVCDTLKEIDIFEQEPPRGQRVTRLLRAINKGSVKGIELLTDLGVDANQKSSREDAKPPFYLPLCSAARRGDTAIVELLIKKRADINARDHFGNNALLSAASSGRNEIIELLLNEPYKADIEVQRTGTDEREGFTPLMLAVYYGHRSSIQALLARGAKRDVVTRAGDSLLHIAARMGSLPTTEFLLANGSQAVTINEKTGETALHCAVRKESLEVAMFLIEKGRLLLEAENKKRQTPLALAVKLKKPQMIEMLLEKGAKPDHVDADERTSLHNAVIGKDSEILRLLVERGAKVESLDKDGLTPLYHAVTTEDPAILAMLLSSGHRWDVKTRSGRYPLQYVMEMPPERESQALSLLRECLKIHRKGNPFHIGYHALPRAAHEGKLGHVKEMLNHDPELVDKKPLPASRYQPPLHEAVKAGKEEVVKELCAPRSYTLSLDQRDHRGNTALHQAILSNQIAMISLLIEKGADKELPSGQTEGLLPPLHLASREQNLLAVKTLLRKGVDGQRRVTNVPLCDKCRAMKILPNGGNARCVLRNLNSSLRRADFQELDNVLVTPRRA